MSSKVEIGKEYFHYKDKEKKYKVLYIGKLQINDKKYDHIDVVVYEALYDGELGKIWVRPLAEFLEKFLEVK